MTRAAFYGSTTAESADLGAQALRGTGPRGFGKLLGVVQVEIGASVWQLPVEAVTFSQDRKDSAAGGFFDDGCGRIGILVSSDASPDELNDQIKKAAADAVDHLSRHAQN
jgi:hypothetical protein